MVGDVFIIITLCVSGILIFKLARHSRNQAIISYLLIIPLSLFLLLSIILPNISWIVQPFFPSFRVKVINEETGLPVSNATVALNSGYSYYEFPYHDGDVSTLSYISKTDANGEIEFKRMMKNLNFKLLPLYSREYRAPEITAYVSAYKTNGARVSQKLVILKMKKYKSPKEIYEDVNDLRLDANIEKRRGNNKVADIIEKITVEKIRETNNSYKLNEEKQ